MWDGQMALQKRQKVAGRLLAPSRVLPYPGPALLSQEDKARTVFLLQLQQANPDQGAVIYHMAGTPFCFTHRRTTIPLLPQQPLPGALVSKAPAWAPWQRRGAGRGHSTRVEGLGPRAG